MSAREAIAEIERAATTYATAVKLEQALELDRCKVKEAAILRILGPVESRNINPLTGKAHSASSAEAIVEQDEEYYRYRASQTLAVVNKIEAEAALEAAKLTAELEVALVKRIAQSAMVA